ncbi:MAG TPA: polysaccharide deacetylase family protein [Terriglobales bacterium]|jgi:peptidoglycan/xylan/chitin deacetylase (PgdA/CDA1 family)
MLEYLAGGAAALAAAAATAGYQSMGPTAQWYGRTFIGLPRNANEIALTYDDGPNDPHTFHLLDVLAKHNVHATFFMIGRYAEKRPDIAQQVMKAGHAIGNHTFTHPALALQPAVKVRAELADGSQALNNAIGAHSNLFRPPFGSRRPVVLRIARELGLLPVMWNVTGYDWSAKSAESIEKNVARQVRGGDVLLLHDGGHLQFGTDRSFSVQATDRMIALYKSQGREFLTIPEMMQKG